MRKFSALLLIFAVAQAVPVEESHITEKLMDIQEMPYETVPVPEPAFNAQRDVRFLLFTRFNPTIAQQLNFRDLNSLGNSNYNVNRPTRVLIHGFQSDATADVNILGTAAFLRLSDVNFIVGELFLLFSFELFI